MTQQELQIIKNLKNEGDWTVDIANMHDKFKVHEWVQQQVAAENHEVLREFLKFRIKFLNEELQETQLAFYNSDPEEILDGLIDLCVIAIGTMDAFQCKSHEAWDEVHTANMSKEVGIKASRPNPLGLPDMIKPEGWTGPDHSDKTGILWMACEQDNDR